jgi:hypothetical protein
MSHARIAVEAGVTRSQLAALLAAGVIDRVFADTYRMTARVKTLASPAELR